MTAGQANMKTLLSFRSVAAASAAALCALAVSARVEAVRSPAADTVPQYLYGPNLVRARAIVKASGVLHDYRIERGQIKSLAAGAITLKERIGLSDPIPISVTARIQVNGRLSGSNALKKGMSAIVIRDGDAPAELVQASSRALLTNWLVVTYFGPSMVRLEAIVKRNGTPAHDYRLDRGRIRAVAPGSVTLRERDGQLFTIPVSATAKVKLNGRLASLAALRRGMSATTLYDNNDPAEFVQAFTH
jgi:hypothetical protein